MLVPRQSSLCQNIVMKIFFLCLSVVLFQTLVCDHVLLFYFFQEFNVTDDDDNNQCDVRGSQLVQVQKKESIIEKSLVKLKETSTVWISMVFHQSQYDLWCN